jgi:hypothetical protein
MTKNWKKIGTSTYTFSINDKEVGVLEIILNSIDSRAIAKTEKGEFTVRRTGFWKTKIEILDKEKKIIANAYAEKWYANSLILEFKSKKYKLQNRNNPLSEWAITDGDKTILAYGLNTCNINGLVNMKITGSENNEEELFDYFLWYLFAPIASENMGDDVTAVLISTMT